MNNKEKALEEITEGIVATAMALYTLTGTSAQEIRYQAGIAAWL
jgi:hypothetical protein